MLLNCNNFYEIILSNGISPYSIFYSIDGHTQPPITVLNEGSLFISMLNSGVLRIDSVSYSKCMDRNLDSLSLKENPFPTPVLKADTTICFGESLTIGVDNIYSNYEWNPVGFSGNSIEVILAGQYSVEVTDNNGCKGRASVNVFMQDLPQPNLGADITICKGDSFLLNPGDFDKCFWLHNNVNTKTVWVKNAQKYIVEVVDNNNCKSKDTIDIKHQILQLDLAPIFYTCANERVIPIKN